MKRPVLGLIALLALSGAAGATPRLGAALPPNLSMPVKNQPGLVVFYARSCQEPAAWAGLWAALTAAGLPVLAVNAPENGQASFPPPKDIKISLLGWQSGQVALAATRAVAVREYPTILVIDAGGRIRAVLEGWAALTDLPRTLEFLR